MTVYDENHPDTPTTAIGALALIEARVERALDGDSIEDPALDAPDLGAVLLDIWQIADAGLKAEALHGEDDLTSAA